MSQYRLRRKTTSNADAAASTDTSLSISTSIMVNVISRKIRSPNRVLVRKRGRKKKSNMIEADTTNNINEPVDEQYSQTVNVNPPFRRSLTQNQTISDIVVNLASQPSKQSSDPTSSNTHEVRADESNKSISNDLESQSIETNSISENASGPKSKRGRRRVTRSIDALNIKYNNEYPDQLVENNRTTKLKYTDQNNNNTQNEATTIKYIQGGWRVYGLDELAPLPNVGYCPMNKHHFYIKKNSSGENEIKIVKSILKSK